MQFKCFISFKNSASLVSCFVVDNIGRTSDLCLLWKKDIDILIRSYSQYHIDSLIYWENIGSLEFMGI